MAFEIKVPPLAESVVEATVARWVKPQGAAVKAGELVAELGTDKVNVEVFTDVDGVLERIDQQEGAIVHVGDVLAVVAEGAAEAAAQLASATAASRDGQHVAARRGEVSSPAPAEATAQDNGRAHATPVAARLATENRLDLSQVAGSGPGGKILKEDVQSALARAPQTPPDTQPLTPNTQHPTPNTQRPTPEPDPSLIASILSAGGAADREERVPMSLRRQRIAQRLKEAQNTAAMLTTFNEVDMSAVMDLRKRRRDAFKERHGVNLGFMSFFTKAAVGGLKAFPYLNAEIQGTDIVVKRHYDVGIAVATPEGLVVPVIRDADRKTFGEIEKEIAELAKRARENKLTLPELMGGTFTITNGGVFGSLFATPILNTPQVGILGVHAIKERPVVVDGEIVVRPMMYIALSYDHRIVDGAESVQFLVRVKELIESPESLLLEG